MNFRIAPGLPWALVAVLSACSDEPAEESTAQDSLNGFEGTFEFSFDAPYRMEPRPVPQSSPVRYEFDPIPIELTIHDEDTYAFDSCVVQTQSCPNGPKRLGDVCYATVTRFVFGQTGTPELYSFSEFAEVQKTGVAPDGTGLAYWPHPTDPDPTPPWHGLCRPAQNENCDFYRTVRDTSEWHATILHRGVPGAGGDVTLRIELIVSKDVGDCSDIDSDRIVFTNWVNVRSGPQPLPRFPGDEAHRWVYGDLHYHSQATDNEGESAHSYRGTIRAMGAMGLDFAFATDHASNSKQYVDLDFSIDIGSWEFGDGTIRGLRDNSDERFRFSRDELLNGPAGANTLMKNVWPLDRPIVPQLFLGGEVDVVPEVSRRPQYSHDPPLQLPNQPPPPPWPPGATEDEWFVPYGNGLQYDLSNVCGGWIGFPVSFESCPGLTRSPDDLFTSYVDDDGNTAYQIHDNQGINDISNFGRQHLVYLPTSPSIADAFVPSDTSEFGGGTRRLLSSGNQQGLVDEILQKRGFAFLAHPLSSGGGPVKPGDLGGRADPGGGRGPDFIPYTPYQLKRVFAHRAILGLQLWNDNARLRTGRKRGCTPPLEWRNGSFQPNFADPEYLFCADNDWKETGFTHVGTLSNGSGHTQGWAAGEFELQPQYDRDSWVWEKRIYGVEHKLHHGTALWDRMLRWGLDVGRTRRVDWLSDGEPRRTFMAGGSDAHGDFNYHRSGYAVATSGISDTALGSVRNLVSAGEPRLPPCKKRDENCPTPPGPDENFPHSQEQIMEAISDGAFSVTDGPAVRIVIDTNRDNEIDVEDAPMGSIVDLYGADKNALPITVQWSSTEEFGPVKRIDLYIGVDSGRCDSGEFRCQSASPLRARTFAPSDHGARRIASMIPQDDDTQPDPNANECNGTCQMEDGYWLPGDREARNWLRYVPTTSEGFAGEYRIELDLDRFPIAAGPGNRFYIRAFARTASTQSSCQPGANPDASDFAERNGDCIPRYGFTNPVWALAHAWAFPDECPYSDNALDRDGDGFADICDGRPDDPDNGSWSRRIGGLSQDQADSVVFDPSGSIIVAGAFRGTADVEGTDANIISDGSKDSFIAKYNKNGLLLWVETLGGTGYSVITDIAADKNDGSIVAVGWFSGQLEVDNQFYTANQVDAFVVKVSASGTTVWTRIMTGTDREELLGVDISQTGRIVVGGHFRRWVRHGQINYTSQGSTDGFIAWFGATGSLQNWRNIGGVGRAWVEDVNWDGTSGVVAVGRFDGVADFEPYTTSPESELTGDGGQDTFVVRYDGYTYDWHAYAGGYASYVGDTSAKAVTVDSSGDVFVVGHFVGWMAVESGNYAQMRGGIFGGRYAGFRLRFRRDGTPVVTGPAQFGEASGHVFINDIAVNQAGEQVITGRFSSDALNFSVQNSKTLHRRAYYDAFVARFNADESLDFAQNYGENENSYNYGYAIDLDDDGNAAFAGRFQSSIQIEDSRMLLGNNTGDGFVARLVR